LCIARHFCFGALKRFTRNTISGGAIFPVPVSGRKPEPVVGSLSKNLSAFSAPPRDEVRRAIEIGEERGLVSEEFPRLGAS
jgi:hypothetical protein